MEQKSRIMANQIQKITVAMNEGLRRSLTLQGEVQQMQQFLDDAVTRKPVEFLNHLQKHLERIDQSIRREFKEKMKPDLKMIKDD